MRKTWHSAWREDKVTETNQREAFQAIAPQVETTACIWYRQVIE